MNKLVATKLAVLAIGALAILGAVVPAQVAVAAVSALVIDDQDKAVNANGVGLTTCNGGVQESSMVRMNDLPTALVENGAFAPLPGAVVNFSTPAGDTDQAVVIFSAEARLEGQPLTYVTPVDFLQVRVLMDGVPMTPLNDLTFTSGAGEANAAQACKRVSAPAAAAAAHVVTVEWLLVDQSGAMLTGVLDDWALRVEINN